MRVATAHSYDTTIAQITKRQAEMAAQQERISSGKQVLRASDDPVAAALSEAVQTRLSRVQTDQRALESSRTSIQQAESALGNPSGSISPTIIGAEVAPMPVAAGERN